MNPFIEEKIDNSEYDKTYPLKILYLRIYILILLILDKIIKVL